MENLHISTSILFASLFWGTIGFGYYIYGKKQGSFVPMIGGILMMIGSYFCPTALMMSLVTIGLIVAVHLLLRQGY
ncbi:MAG TPA: hypothetical protein VHH73_00620 [Verrucomicrobiae bacterium]|nr:hypothetical protein [Verrucomicrobiae bacterium]